MKLNFNERNGITLIALVITIIVLLILAGVAIVTLTGENGILNQASKAKEETEKAQAEEEVKLAIGNLQIEENQRNLEQNEKASILEQELKELYSKQEPATTVNTSGEGFKISHRGYEFNADSNYNVTYQTAFDAEKWDEDAAEEDCFYWASNDQNEEGYGTVIGYTKNIDNYPTLRFPSRCTKIEFSYDKNYDEVTNETSRAFTNNILKVEIPGTVTSIGDGAFGDPMQGSFKNLEEVVMENGLTSIGSEAFAYCTNLSIITMPNSLTSIGWNAFAYCTNLSSITIPNSVTSIELQAFIGWTSSQMINIQGYTSAPSGWNWRLEQSMFS